MKKTSLFVVLFMALFGSFIGFDPNGTTGNVTASPPIVFPEIGKSFNPGPLNLSVDLESGQLTVDNARNGEVNVEVINKVVETPPECITRPKVVKEEIYIENIAKSSKLLQRAAPLRMAPLMP